MAAARAPLPSRLMDMVPERHRNHPFFLLEPSFPRAPGSVAQVSQLSHEIFPRVYLGSVAAAEPEHIAALKITHVVNALGSHAEQCRPRVKYFSAPMMDIASFPVHMFLKPAAAWIAAALAADPETRVLVHCLAGVSRSATLLLAHGMMAHKLRICDAYVRMQTARPQAEPNAGFRAALVQLDEHLFEGAPWPHDQDGLPRSVVIDAIDGAAIGGAATSGVAGVVIDAIAVVEGASAGAASGAAAFSSAGAAGATVDGAGGAVAAADASAGSAEGDGGGGASAAGSAATDRASAASAAASCPEQAAEAGTTAAADDVAVAAVASTLHTSL